MQSDYRNFRLTQYDIVFLNTEFRIDTSAFASEYMLCFIGTYATEETRKQRLCWLPSDIRSKTR